jgi:hypothetical protein
MLIFYYAIYKLLLFIISLRQQKHNYKLNLFLYQISEGKPWKKKRVMSF